MEKSCLILMPIAEPEGYAKGHFNRVYQYIISPACRQAGCSPARIQDPGMNDTTLGILHAIIESNLVICDLSSNNTSGLYGFAIRQSLGLPVVLMKDLKTNLQANIPEFDVMEYDDSLRIDTVETEVPVLGEALRKALDSKSTSDLLTRLNVFTQAEPEPEPEPAPTAEQAETEKQSSHLPFISPLPDYVGEPLTQTEIDRLKVGDFFFHMNYGKAKVLTVNRQTKDSLVKVQFDSGTNVLVLSPSPIFRKVLN